MDRRQTVFVNLVTVTAMAWWAWGGVEVAGLTDRFDPHSILDVVKEASRVPGKVLPDDLALAAMDWVRWLRPPHARPRWLPPERTC